MVVFILRRATTGIGVILAVVTVVFLLVRLTGNPAAALLPNEASVKDYHLLVRDLGLDKPIYVQYGIFLKKLAVGDFGFSAKTRVQVIDLLKERLPNSLKLSLVSMLMVMIMGLPLGALAAVKRGKGLDWMVRLIVAVGQCLPTFWLALLLMQLVAIKWEILPVSGMESFSHYIIPAFSLALYPTAEIMRILRSSMIEVLDSEYIKLARIKGVSETKVIWKHAFRNAVISVTTLSGLYIILLAMGAVIVETIFGWPGIGRMLWEGVLSRDFTVVQAVVFVTTCLVVLANLLVDILYMYIDPRIRYT